MAQKEMPIFTRTFDLLTWLLPMTNHFPRAQRQTVTRRLTDAAFDLRERLEDANLRVPVSDGQPCWAPTKHWRGCACTFACRVASGG